MNRQELLGLLNQSNLSSTLTEVQRLLLLGVSKQLVQNSDGEEEPDTRKYDRMLLDSVGPAAASAAVDYAIKASRKQGQYKSLSFNGSFVNNVKLIQNDDVGAYDSFSNVLRQFLLPRYAYLDFDRLVDPRHQVDAECGYPKFITPIMYRYMYDRDDVARRVVDLYSDEIWSVAPSVYEDEDETTTTPFEQAWQFLIEKHNILQFLYRMDRLCGVGHYGALLLGVDDGEDLEKPIEGITSFGTKDPNPRYRGLHRNLLYMRPFDEYLSFVHQYETDVMNPRYGLPVFYNLVFLDMTIDAAGASIGTRLNRRVHWTRVVHIADNLQSSLVFGVPRMQPVFNRLLDLRKIKGGSAEMFWKGAFPGISFEIDPRLVEDDPEFDKDKFRREIEEYSNGLRRYLTTLGVKANSLAPQVSDPEKHVTVQMQAISSYLGAPLRVFLGSEEGRLASSQDKLTWNQRLGRKLRTFTEPYLLRNVIDRFIAIGIMPPPESGHYFVDWADLNTATDEDKANLALKWTQAMSQYVATGIIHFIGPMDYMTMILGLRPRDAIRIDAYIKENGGYEKLRKVDPSQGAGVNGKRENAVTKGEKEDTSGERPTKRDSSDKEIEGSSS